MIDIGSWAQSEIVVTRIVIMLVLGAIVCGLAVFWRACRNEDAK
jgi:hypothetical protein